MSSSYRYKKRDWSDLALASASFGDAAARPPLRRSHPLAAPRIGVPPRHSRQYARHNRHVVPQPLRPLRRRPLPPWVPTHHLPLRTGMVRGGGRDE